MKDLVDEIGAVHRGVRRQLSDGTEEVVVVLRRSYDAEPADVWAALTDPERLRRWFLPVGGDLRPGGNYQLEGNVGGEIRRCEPPRSLVVTWGMAASVVDVRISADGESGSVLELEHSVPLEIAGSGAGALYVGPGWDISVLALGRFLRGEVDEDPTAWEGTLEGQGFSARAIAAWTEAIGPTAAPEEVDAAAEMARAQFTPDLPAGEPA
jgi:uncharacterized protein YndB with AHSA1/START domain